MTALNGLPELDVARVRRYCDNRLRWWELDSTRVECEVGAEHLTIYIYFRMSEAAEQWMKLAVARFDYSAGDRLWTLSWADRENRFHAYAAVDPAPSVGPLLEALDEDEEERFW